jgi:ATP-binding cassette, subfamily B, bacterial MsbA
MKGQLAEWTAVLRYLRPYFTARPWLLAGILASSLAVMVFEGLGVGLLVPLLNLLLGGEQAAPMRPIQWLERTLPGHSPAFYIATICLTIVAAIAAKNIGFYTSQVLAARLKRQISVTVRDRLFRRLQQADLDVFDRSPGGMLANVFLVEGYRTAMAVDVLLGMLQRSSVAVFYFAALVYLSWPLTILVAVLGLALAGTISHVYRRLTRTGNAVTELNHRMAAALTQSFAGVRTVRATNSQARETGEFHALNLAQARAEEQSAHASSLLFPITETLAVTGGMIIVAAAYVFLVRPGHMLSSYLLAYGFVLLRVLPLLNQLYGLQGHFMYLAGGIREVQTWLEVPIFPSRPFGTTVFRGVTSTLRFEGVSYQYASGTQALRHVDFTVPVGQTVAIVGSSGSGKSTLAAILLRFRAPSAGRLTVDGRDCWDFSPESWHRAVALVEQDAFLFHGTLRENIVYGCEQPDDTRLRQAIAIANLQDVVDSLPAGLDTLVGERGVMVSGGQRQRIAIARAVIRNPAILVLDEATSHLDTVSELLVQQALQNAARGRTTIVIAHRLSTIRQADKLVVLEGGRVVEQGTWESLQGSGGAFHRLVASAARL